ncbi:hypothetical protein CBM2629_B100053 [Cupriavidus taiwanensis]|nr:hypothetical protein CBM2629_B100053 [Cupriavidus taiwanensis]
MSIPSMMLADSGAGRPRGGPALRGALLRLLFRLFQAQAMTFSSSWSRHRAGAAGLSEPA